MRTALAFARAVDRLSRAVGRAMAWATFAMVLVEAANALARSAERELGTRLTTNAHTELAWYLFGAVVLLAAPDTLRSDRHVRVDVLYARHPPRARAWIDLAGGVLFLVPFCALAAWTSLDFAAESWRVRETSSDPGGLPRWPLKAVVPVAFGLLLLQALSEIVKRIALLRGCDPAELGIVEPGASYGAGSDG